MNEKAKQMWYARPVFFVRDCVASSAFYAHLGFREILVRDLDGNDLVFTDDTVSASEDAL